MSALVIGVGSPFGDDRVGWEVVAAVRMALRSAPAPVRTLACDRPGAALLEALEGVKHAVIVDAARAGDCPPGSLRWLDGRGLEGERAASSHGFGLAEALALARALGDAPRRVDVLAIAAVRFEGDALSEPVRAAVPLAARAVLERIDAQRVCVHGDPGE